MGGTGLSEREVVSASAVRPRARSIIGAIALIVMGVIAALLLAEAAVRIAFAPVRGVSWYHYDSRYTMRYRANIDVMTNDWGDGRLWRFATNSRGFVGGDWSAVPAAGVARVIVAGDSFTAGNGIDAAGAYPEVAQRILRAANERVDVVNLGVSAWGPQNALGYLSSEGADIRASCLVYGFFLGNDVADNVRYGLFVLGDGRLVRAKRAPAPNASLVRYVMRSLPLYDFLIAHSELFNLLRKGVIGAAARRNVKMSQADSMPTAEFDRALDLNDATLSAMADFAHRRYGGFGLILIPMRAELTHFGQAPFSVERAEQSRVRVRRWAQDHRVHVLDLTDEFPRERASADKLYFSRDFHWNGAGQRLAGRLMAENLGPLCGGSFESMAR
jgi:hypothetical protein